MKIRLCEKNKGSGQVFKRLKENFPDANIKRKDCVKQCSCCRQGLFASVGGKPVTAASAEELYAALAERLTLP
jgi:uncharacterized protein YuzB (UPF0349 family)